MRPNPRVTFGVTVVLAAAALAVTALPAAAAPPPPPSKDPAKPVADHVQPGSHALRPDISVKSAWIGAGPVSQAWTPLPANPTVWAGDTIWLGCDVGISGSIPPQAFKMAWYIDGQKTCGEGIDSLSNAPVCEWTYSISVGHQVLMSYVPRAAGTHTYRCAVDIANQVDERNESNNSSADLPFRVARKLTARPAGTAGVTGLGSVA
jgi:hypothetical protein